MIRLVLLCVLLCGCREPDPPYTSNIPPRPRRIEFFPDHPGQWKCECGTTVIGSRPGCPECGRDRPQPEE